MIGGDIERLAKQCLAFLLSKKAKQCLAFLRISRLLLLCAIQNYNQATINNINRLYEDIELNQIFNTGYICKLFSCSSSGARKILARLRIIDVIVPVKGKGKGQYRFKYKSEM